MSEVRSVNGWGPRCGCGGQSVIHHTSTWHGVSPETSLFLCLACAEQAFRAFVATHPHQPPYWPGDDGRDEPYVHPTAEAP